MFSIIKKIDNNKIKIYIKINIGRLVCIKILNITLNYREQLVHF